MFIKYMVSLCLYFYFAYVHIPGVFLLAKG